MEKNQKLINLQQQIVIQYANFLGELTFDLTKDPSSLVEIEEMIAEIKTIQNPVELFVLQIALREGIVTSRSFFVIENRGLQYEILFNEWKTNQQKLLFEMEGVLQKC